MEAIVNGITGPIVTPFVRRGERLFDLCRLLKRSEPAIVFKGRIQEFPNYGDWVDQSKRVLRAEPWLQCEFDERTVPLGLVGAALLKHGLCAEEEADWLQTREVTLLGHRKPHKRLAVVIAAISSGVLRGERGRQDGTGIASDDSDQADDSFVTAKTHLFADAEGPDDSVNAAFDVRPQGQQAWFGTPRSVHHQQMAFGTNKLDDGLPLSMSQVVLKLELEILCQPRLRVFVPERTTRDLKRFLYDARGCLKVQVNYTARIFAPGGEVQSWSALTRHLDNYFPTANLAHVVTQFVCERTHYDSDGHYHHPVRDMAIDCSALHGRGRWYSGLRDLWTRWGYEADAGTGKIYFNRNRRLSPKCHQFLEGCRFVGYLVEPSDLDVGFFWLHAKDLNDANDAWWIYLGNATDADIAKCHQNLPESIKQQRNVTLYRWNRQWSPPRFFPNFSIISDASETRSLQEFAAQITLYCTPVYGS